MRSTIISAGSIAVAMTLQASAAPTHGWKRSLELDLSEIDNRAYDLDVLDARQQRTFIQKVGDKVTAFVKSPTVQAIGSAVGSAAVAAAMNRIIKRDLELDPSEIESRDFEFDEVESREPLTGELDARSMRLPSPGAFRATLQRIATSPTAGRFLRTAARVVSSPTARTVAHRAGQAIRRVFGPRPRSLQLSEIESRDFDLDEIEAREPKGGRPGPPSAFRATLQRIAASPGAGTFLRTAARGAYRVANTRVMRKFTHYAGKAAVRLMRPRDLEVDAPELTARELEFLEALLQDREFNDLYERQAPGAPSPGRRFVNWAKNSQTLRDFGKSVISGALNGVSGSISPVRREFNPADEMEFSERDLDDLLELANRDLELNELD
ncbi:hypothetical protein MD484_g7758, partial [Candolleomyces efflorescens]